MLELPCGDVKQLDVDLQGADLARSFLDIVVWMDGRPHVVPLLRWTFFSWSSGESAPWSMVTCEKMFVILFVSAVKKITDKAILAGLGTFSQTDKQFVGFVPGLRLCILGTVRGPRSRGALRGAFT